MGLSGVLTTWASACCDLLTAQTRPPAGKPEDEEAPHTLVMTRLDSQPLVTEHPVVAEVEPLVVTEEQPLVPEEAEASENSIIN